MQINVSIDIADACQQALNDSGTHACARPLPHDLKASLPITLVESIGGGERTARVLDRFPIRLTTWAETPADAVEEANLAMARLAAYEGRRIGGVQCYRVTPLSTPYEPVDPNHPDIPRAIQTAHLWVRTITTDE
jgi:hypothetical protein